MLIFPYSRVRDFLIFSAQLKMEYIMSVDPNDDRSDSMNPNNDAYDDSMDNHSNQLNPNNDEKQTTEDTHP
jgi:hypothetical protein